MATVYVTLGQVTAYGVFDGDAVRSETITSSGTSASGALTAVSATEYAQIYCATAVYARSGGTATAATSIYCPPDFPTNIRMTAGDAVSVIDA
jgi:hypothetical protein